MGVRTCVCTTRKVVQTLRQNFRSIGVVVHALAPVMYVAQYLWSQWSPPLVVRYSHLSETIPYLTSDGTTPLTTGGMVQHLSPLTIHLWWVHYSIYPLIWYGLHLFNTSHHLCSTQQKLGDTAPRTSRVVPHPSTERAHQA